MKTLRRATQVACLLSVGAIAAAQAELPSIRFDRLTPLGAAAGASVEAEIAGADVEEVRSLWFDHPGLSAEPIEGKERWFRIRVAADVPPGTYDVRLVGRWGVSNPRLFAVDHGLTDVSDTERNNDPSQAQVVPLNCAVAGMSDGNNEDVFRFSAKAGQRIVIDCQAGKLDSLMDATMSLATADGKLLASSSDHNGRDPLIDFVVPSDGEFLVRVHDLSYRAGFPYRPRTPISRMSRRSILAPCRPVKASTLWRWAVTWAMRLCRPHGVKQSCLTASEPFPSPHLQISQ